MRGLCSRALLTLAVMTPTAVAEDWPQWMGPTRDGVWKETGIVDKFPQGGPKKLWSVPLNGGYSGPSVVDGKVFITDWVMSKDAKAPKGPFDSTTSVAGTERVLCLDAKSGKEIWKYEYPSPYQVSYGSGPRCTPTIHQDKVYTLGTMGDLFCLNLADGKPLWQKDFKKEYKAKTPLWGFTGHPLVYENLLICLVGGEKALVVAFDRTNGQEVWKSLSPAKPGAAGYSPPKILEIDGKQQLVQFHPTAVTSLDPKTGKEHWSVSISPPAQDEMSIMTPQISGHHIYVGARGGGSVAVNVGSSKPDAAWRGDPKKKTGVNPINMTPFLDGDTIYGVDGPGMLRAVDLKTGNRLWYSFLPVIEDEQEETFGGAGSGTAFLVKNGDRFFIFNEKGSLIIAKLTREGYHEIDKAKLLDVTSTSFGRRVVWSHPAFANKCIFVRNDKEIACFSLAKE